MGGPSPDFGGLGDAISGIASVAAAPETGGASLMALAPSAISAAGSLGGALINQSGVQSQNQAALANMNAANAFSAQQFATRYQTTVKDLEAAGLNPMLAYSQGGGSPPSSASPAPVQNTKAGASQYFSEAAQKAYGAANIAMDTQQKDANVTNTISQTGVNEQQRKYVAAQTEVAAVDAILKAKQGGLIDQQTATELVKQSLMRAQTRATGATEQYTKALTRTIAPDAQLRTDENGKATTYGKVRSVLKDVSQGLNSATNAASALKGKPPVNYQPTINNYEAPQ
jgi:hypothetical protein